MPNDKPKTSTTVAPKTEARADDGKPDSVGRPRARLTLAQLFAVPSPFVFQRGDDTPRTAENAPWIIYELIERWSGRIYIGVTRRPLDLRTAAHVSQARRDGGVRPDGLMAAIRAMDARNESFAEAFAARIVARASTAAEAAELECQWVEMLSCRTPEGFNAQPPGNLGNPGNAQGLRVLIAPGQLIYFSSIHRAIGDRNRQLRASNEALLEPGTIYARLSAGWSPEEALGYRDHVDGRGLRDPFLVHGREYTTLRQASRASGIPIATLRSRHHRRVMSWPSRGPIDIGTDRRHENGAERELLAILWPETGEKLTAKAFAKRVGMPAATVIHRWHRARAWEAERIREGRPPLTPEQLVARLTSTTDRRKWVAVTLPDGRRWHGGEREIIRRLLLDRSLETERAERLSESGIRRRLRVLTPAQRDCPNAIRHAFGFAPAEDKDPETGSSAS